MDYFERILREEGLYHLKDDAEKLREEILKRLGLLELKDSPCELLHAMQKLLETNRKKFKNTKKELGNKIIDVLGRRN
jgi:hypothetical protein